MLKTSYFILSQKRQEHICVETYFLPFPHLVYNWTSDYELKTNL